MRVGIVTAVYKPVQNGVTRIVSLYQKYLHLAGHEAYIFTFGEPESENEEGIIRSPGMVVGQTGYSLALRYSKPARALLSTMDVVHCHHPLMGLEFARRYSQAPIVFTNHTRYDLYAATYLPLPHQISSHAVDQLLPVLVNKSDWIIAPSEFVAKRLTESGVTRPISVIKNGIEIESFSSSPSTISRKDLGIPQDSVLLIYLGRLSAEKSVDKLLNIFSIARQKKGNLYLMLVGGGPMRDQLERDVIDFNLTHSVRFIDEVPFSAVPGYLSLGDIFVTASDSEVHPLTVIEAMAAGLPVIGRFEKGLSETVQHGINGFIKSSRDEESAEDIIRLASDHELRRKMGMASRQMSKQFHIQNTIDQSIDVYQRLLDSSTTDRALRSSRISRHSLLSSVASRLLDARPKPDEYHHDRTS